MDVQIHRGRADRGQDTLFAARAALKRAQTVRHAAELQVDQMRRLVDRLEREQQPERPSASPVW
jgi:hypothetical protein